MNKLLAAAADISSLNVTPLQSGLPGGTFGSHVVGGAIFYGLLLTLVGFVLSAGLWAVGSWSSNYTQAINGKKGFLICAACALIIGGAYLIESFFFGKGQTLG